MSYLSQRGDQSTSLEIEALANLTALAVSGIDEFIQKTGPTTFRNAVPSGSGGGSGTVTSVGVAIANGFYGSVATSTTTPIITIATTMTAGSVIIAGSSGSITQDNSNFFYNTATSSLGLGTTSPSAVLHIIRTTEQFRIGYDTSNYWNSTTSSTGVTTFDAVGSAAAFIFSNSVSINGSSKFLSAGRTSQINGLGKIIISGTGTGTDAPFLFIKHETDDSAVKNAGIFTQTRMTSRYLQTIQNIGQNDNSFGNAGVIQWTAWEYSNVGFSTLVAPTEFTGWMYQYYNGSAYINLFRIHTSGIGIGLASASTTPSAKLHVISTTEQLRLGYDTSNYFTTTVGSNGRVSFDSISSTVTPGFIFKDRVAITGFGGATTQNWNYALQLSENSSQTYLQFTTSGSGHGSSNGFIFGLVDGTGVRYINVVNSPHIFYINGAERVRFAETGAVIQVSNSDCAKFIGSGTTYGGTLRLVNDATTTQEWMFGVGGTDNAVVNGKSLFISNVTSSTYPWFINTSGDMGIGLGTNIASARTHIIKTTEQLRIGYDTSNYYSTTVSSTGTVTFNAVGTGSKFVFSDNIELTQTVTTEAVTSDTTVTIVINGTTYKLLAKA